MAKTIPQLTDATTVNAADELIIQQGGITKRATGAELAKGLNAINKTLNIRDFGVVGDGSDESAKVQAALDAINASGGGTLRFNGEVIRCDSPLVGYSNTRLIGSPNATIDFSYRASRLNTVDQGLFVFRGSAAAPQSLASDAAFETNVVALSSTTGFSEGDLIELSMDNEGSFPDTSINVKSGQLNIVTKVNASSLVLDTAVMEPLGYSVANTARVRKIAPVENVTIEGMTFIGGGRPASTAGDYGLRIFFGKNVAIKNCVFRQIDARALEVVGCYNFTISGNELYFDNLDTNTNVSYGVIFSSSSFGNIVNNVITKARHGIVSSHLSTNATFAYYGVSRFVNIANNVVTGNYGDLSGLGYTASHAGISTHIDCELVNITGNHVSGCKHGINPRTFNVCISNNIVSGNDVGIYLSGVYNNIAVMNNHISGGDVAIADDSNTNVHSNIVISGNILRRTGSISITASTSSVSYGFVCSSNHISDYSGSSSTGVIVLNGALSGAISNNIIDGASIPAIRLGNTTGMVVRGNTISRTGRPLNILDTNRNTTISDNTFMSNTNESAVNPLSTTTISGNANYGSASL